MHTLSMGACAPRLYSYHLQGIEDAVASERSLVGCVRVGWFFGGVDFSSPQGLHILVFVWYYIHIGVLD